jgi:hypothetical protein
MRFREFRQLVRHCILFRDDILLKTERKFEVLMNVAVFPWRRSCIDPDDGFFREME